MLCITPLQEWPAIVPYRTVSCSHSALGVLRMCRFTVRPGAAAPQPADPAALEQQPISLEQLFAGDDGELGADGEPWGGGAGPERAARQSAPALAPSLTLRPAAPPAADLALLALFTGATAAGNEPDARAEPHSAGSSAGSPVEAPAAGPVVLGQVMTAPAPQTAPAAPAAVPAPPANPVQQLQMQAVLQHQAAIMQNPTAFPAAAQMYQQAMLQQQQQQMAMAAAQQHAAYSGGRAYSGGLPPLPAAAAPLPPLPVAVAPQAAGAPALPLLMGKRSKTVEEVEEQTERIKKRRRESAQRSRQRKNAYMKGLEMENRALKLENERLRCVASLLGAGGFYQGAAGSAPPRWLLAGGV